MSIDLLHENDIINAFRKEREAYRFIVNLFNNK